MLSFFDMPTEFLVEAQAQPIWCHLLQAASAVCFQLFILIFVCVMLRVKRKSRRIAPTNFEIKVQC